jgi:hypothetical protein
MPAAYELPQGEQTGAKKLSVYESRPQSRLKNLRSIIDVRNDGK